MIGKTLTPAFSPDGKQLFFQRGGNVWVLSTSDGTEQPVTDLVGRKGRLGGNLPGNLASDGEYLYFGWREDIGDIWVMDVVRE